MRRILLSYVVVIGLLVIPAQPVWSGAIVPPGNSMFPQSDLCLVIIDPSPIGGRDSLCGWGFSVPVEYSPGAGPWIKTLTVDKFSDDYFFVNESISVAGQTPDWSDWHEEILNPNWEWASGLLPGTSNTFVDARITTSLGETVFGIYSSNDTVLDFFFSNTIPSGQNESITISKTLHWTGVGTAPIGSFAEVAEFPTVVPIPAAVWLLISGLVALTAISRRR